MGMVWGIVPPVCAIAFVSPINHYICKSHVKLWGDLEDF